MNTLQQFKLKLQIRIEPAIEFGSDLLRDMWQHVLAEREARIQLMTDGHLYQKSGTLRQVELKEGEVRGRTRFDYRSGVAE